MPVRSIQRLATAVVSLLAAQIVLMIAESVTHLYRLGLLRRVQTGGLVSQAEGERADGAVEAVTGIWSLLFIATVVVWCVWQHRAQRNAGHLATGDLRFTPGWAVGWWFIPFANLVKPFQTMRELWKASHAGDDWSQRRTWPVIGWWWAFWIAGNVHVWFGPDEFGFGMGTGGARGPSTISGLISRDIWEIGSLGFRVVAAILAIVIVRSIVELQGATPIPQRPMALSDMPPLPPPPS